MNFNMSRLRASGRRHLPISTRLAAWYGLTLLLLLSLFAFFCYAYMHRSVHRDFDRHLTHEKMQLLPHVELRGPEPSMGLGGALRSASYQTDGIFGTYVRLLRTDGSVLALSSNFERHAALPVQLPERPGEVFLSQEWESKPARTVYTPLSGPDGVLKGWLEITGFEWSLHQDLYRLAQALFIGIAFSILLSIGGGYMLARRVLRPVAALTDAARDIHATDLAARLPTRLGVHDELTDLAETFNEMIARLEASFNRERRFTSNAAHELLTPLTTMRNQVEVTLRRAREQSGYQATLRTLMVDIDEMAEMVRGLLQLAQAERARDLPRVEVDLGAIVEEHASRFAERAAGRDQRFSVNNRPDVCILADPMRIGEVVANLVDNAIKYTPDGGLVQVEVKADGGLAKLTVTDSGIGFEPNQGEQLFDRFYRADMQEVQERPGSGLGLAIVQTIVQAYGGSVLARSPGLHRGSVFEVALPLAREATCSAGLGGLVSSEKTRALP